MNKPGWIAKSRTSVGSSSSMGKSGKANPKKMKDKGTTKILDAKVNADSVNVGKIGKING